MKKNSTGQKKEFPQPMRFSDEPNDFGMIGFSNSYMYFSIAYRGCVVARETRISLGKMSDEGIGSADISSRQQRATLLAIVFGALFLEAFVNEYALNAFDSLAVRKIRDLPHVKKWEVASDLVCRGNGCPANVLDKIKKIVSVRNDLVHLKPENLFDIFEPIPLTPSKKEPTLQAQSLKPLGYDLFERSELMDQVAVEIVDDLKFVIAWFNSAHPNWQHLLQRFECSDSFQESRQAELNRFKDITV
jgi:hypothetical protein